MTVLLIVSFFIHFVIFFAETKIAQQMGGLELLSVTRNVP